MKLNFCCGSASRKKDIVDFILNYFLVYNERHPKYYSNMKLLKNSNDFTVNLIIILINLGDFN